MSRFAGKSSDTAKANRDFIRINPYEIPEMALSVIANICNKNNTDDANPIIQAIRTELLKKGKNGLNFYELIEQNRHDLFNIDLLVDIRTQLSEIAQELESHENTNDTQVVVAGGFSAGKSSFLNALTGAGDLLPTGIDPCSMVQTYLYCSAKTKNIIVKGINLKDAVVLLDKYILQSIQHESKSKVYLASVLDKLFVEIPSTKLDGFVFIDTPGYNNSEKKNTANNRTDEDTAKDAINRGNVLLWVIDAGAGTIPKIDLEMIRDFVQEGEDRKIAIVFNKADKKGRQEIQKIVKNAYSLISDLGDRVIDVFGFSSHENEIYYSYKGLNMSQLLAQLRSSGTGNSGIARRKDILVQLFNDEINYAKEVGKSYMKKKSELVCERNEAYKYLNDEKDGTKDYIKDLTDIMIENYDEILDAAEKLRDNGFNALTTWRENLKSILADEKSKFHSHDSVISKISDSDKRRIRFWDHQNCIDFEYYSKDDRQEWVERIKVQLERVDQNLESRYDSLNEEEEQVKTNIQKFRDIASEIERYRDIVKRTLDYKIREFQATAHKVQDARLDFAKSTDIFTAIHSGSYNDFMNCFITGVKLSQTNPEGYSPLTYAVKMNKYDMVKFLMDNGAGADDNDARGMNAFLTAVENANGALIDFFMKIDPSLSNSRNANGESALTIAEKKDLNKWYKSNVK